MKHYNEIDVATTILHVTFCLLLHLSAEMTSSSFLKSQNRQELLKPEGRESFVKSQRSNIGRITYVELAFNAVT
jgi:hypothetical protein